MWPCRYSCWVTARGRQAKQVERAASILHRETIQRAVRHVVSIERFVDLFREVVQDLGTEKRVYVLIDDLDRCLPETALQIFEAIKLFLDSEQCAYVVAVDRAVIRRGLELRYPARSIGEAARYRRWSTPMNTSRRRSPCRSTCRCWRTKMDTNC